MDFYIVTIFTAIFQVVWINLFYINLKICVSEVTVIEFHGVFYIVTTIQGHSEYRDPTDLNIKVRNSLVILCSLKRSPTD